MTSRFCQEEVLVPYLATLAAEPLATRLRGTLLAASTQTLRKHGHFERYARELAPEHLTAIVSAVAGMWLPMEVGTAHYRACDALHLSTDEQLAIGSEIVHNLQRTFIGSAIKAAASGVGISPLVGFQKFAVVFNRSFRGGGARVDFVGLPLAAIPYFTSAWPTAASCRRGASSSRAAW